MPEAVQWLFEDNQVLCEKLGTVLKSWENTPYRHHCGVKKRGTDCVHFVLRVFEELEVVQPNLVMIPYYPPDWHLHRGQELLRKVFDSDPNVRNKVVPITYPQDVPMDGDIVVMKFGRTDSHGAIFYGSKLYQAITGIGVRGSQLCERKWSQRAKSGYRIIK